MIGIYKITNKINNKVYIGQSNYIEKRWEAHKTRPFNRNSHDYDCIFYRAIRKYGIDNFSFEILEKCKEDELNDREKYWIKYYNSYLGFKNCKGYNMTLGGQNSVPHKLSYDQVKEIQNLLLTTRLPQTKIGEQYNISQITVSQINCGIIWHNDNYDYPLREKKVKHNYCIDCGKEINLSSTRCVSCAIKARPKSSIKPPKEELEKILIENKGNFTKVGRIYSISDNGVRKWCKTYNLPYHSKDYKPH